MATSPYFSTSNEFIKYDIHADVVSQSIADNTSQVRVVVYCWRTNYYTTNRAGSCYVNIDGSSYSNSWQYGEKPISYNSDTVLFDRTVTIQHGADGKKNIYVEAKINCPDSFSSSYNGFTVTLATIPRKAEIQSAQNFTDEGNPQITYSNPAGENATTLQACISLDGSTALVAYRDINKLGTSYTFNLTSSERNALLASCPNDNSKTVYFIIKTVIAGTTYYSSKTATMAVVNANPSYSGEEYADTNATTVAITGDDQKIIQDKSTLVFTFASITALKSSTLASIAITINSVTVSQSLSGSSASNVSVNFGTVNTSSDINASVVITDSRGNTTAFTMAIEVYGWQAPTAIVKATRQENYYAPTTVYCDASYSSLGGNNTITITWYYKEADAVSYTLGGTLADGGSDVISLNNEKAWNVKFEVADLFASVTYIVNVAEGIPILFIDKGLRSVGIGTVPTETNEICVDRRLELKNLEHESLLDLWTMNNNGFRTAFMKIKNASGNQLALAIADHFANGNYDCGRFAIYNNSGKRLAGMAGIDEGGGCLTVYNSNGDHNVSAFPSYNQNDATKGGGVILVTNHAGNTVGSLYTSANNSSGVFYLANASGSQKILIEGETGRIFCDHVKPENPIVELFDGSLSSGNTTFNYGDYSSYLVFANVRSGGSLLQVTIPKILLDTSDQQFCLSDEVDYITFKMKYSGTTATLTFNSASSSGAVLKVYGVY